MNTKHLILCTLLAALPFEVGASTITYVEGGNHCSPYTWGSNDFMNDEVGMTYAPAATKTGSAHCALGKIAYSTVLLQSARVRYEDGDPSACMNCYWYLKTNTGGTYYIPGSKLYSDGSADGGSSCTNPQYTGDGQLYWPSTSWNWSTVSNVSQVAALCSLPAGSGDSYTIRNYEAEVEILLQ